MAASESTAGGYETETTVTLMNGEVVSIEAYNFAIALETRGISLAADGHDILYRPKRGISQAEYGAMVRLKSDLLRIVRYCARAM